MRALASQASGAGLPQPRDLLRPGTTLRTRAVPADGRRPRHIGSAAIRMVVASSPHSPISDTVADRCGVDLGSERSVGPKERGRCCPGSDSPGRRGAIFPRHLAIQRAEPSVRHDPDRRPAAHSRAGNSPIVPTGGLLGRGKGSRSWTNPRASRRGSHVTLARLTGPTSRPRANDGLLARQSSAGSRRRRSLVLFASLLSVEIISAWNSSVSPIGPRPVSAGRLLGPVDPLGQSERDQFASRNRPVANPPADARARSTRRGTVVVAFGGPAQNLAPDRSDLPAALTQVNVSRGRVRPLSGKSLTKDSSVRSSQNDLGSSIPGGMGSHR